VDRAVAGSPPPSPPLRATAPLRRASVRRVGGNWYASYRQQVGGLDVLFADWEFRVGADGRLFMFGADVHAAPRRRRAAAHRPGRGARGGESGLAFNPVIDRVEGGTDAYLLPWPGETDLAYRLVLEARVLTADRPGTGSPTWTRRRARFCTGSTRVRHTISGTVTGLVHAVLPTDPLTAKPSPHLYVTVGSSQVVTDAAGFYSARARAR